MKKIITIFLLLCSLLLVSCNDTDIGIIGGADGPTNIIVSKNDADKYFKEHYVDERRLPILDIHIENPFVSDDRTLILDDTIENNLELMIYEYYHSLMSGSHKEAKDMIADGSLLAATIAHENNFENGIYYSEIFIDDIDLVDKDDLNKITKENKQAIIKLLEEQEMNEFAIVEVEKTIKHNQKSLSMVPQVGNGDVTRYFVLGKKGDKYKIVEVYWEGFLGD